jgi:serine/threonine-protein kinase
MAGELSRDFFEQLMVSPSSIFQLQVSGLPDYQTALLLKKEMMGLRSILNIDLRSFERNGQSLYEIEFSGKRANFLQILEKAVIEPINMKLGKPILFIISAQGETIQIAFESEGQMNKIIGRLEGGPPSSLLQAHSQRIKNIISSPVLEKKVNAMRAYRSEKLQTHKTNKEYKAIEAF